MKTVINVPALQDLPAAAHQIVGLMGDRTVFALRGEMGAGKTTLVRELCTALGVDPSETSSATFALVNEYRSDTTAELIYHFDLYRLEKLEEALDMGIEDYLDSGAVCLIEWPGMVDDILPGDTVDLNITVDEATGARTIVYDDHDD